MQSRIRYASAVDGIVASFVASTIGLTLYLILLGVLWGAGPVVAVLPLYVPTAEGIALVLALAITNLCYGRYLALGEPPVLWIALAFWANAILATLFILTFPGLLGSSGVLSASPETAGWLRQMKWTALAVGLLGAVSLASAREEPRRNLVLLMALVGALALGLGLLVVALQWMLPPLLIDGHWTVAASAWTGVLAVLFIAEASIGLRRYLRDRNWVVGWAAIVGLFAAAVMVGSIIGEQQFDLWFYLDRILLVFGFAWMLYGIMAEYVQLYQESESRRTLAEAMLENAPAAIALLRPPGYQLVTANPAFSALVGAPVGTGRRAATLWPLLSQELIPMMDTASRTGDPLQLEDVAWPLSPAPGHPPSERHFNVSLVPLRSPQGPVERVLLVMHETTAEVLSLRRLEALLAVAEAGLAATGLDPVLETLVQKAPQALGAPMAAILLREAGGRLVVRKLFGLPDEVRSATFHLHQGLVGRVAAERRPIQVSDGDSADSAIDAPFGAQGARAMLGVPIVVERRLIGVFLVGHLEVREFSAGEVRFLEAMGERAGIAVERARHEAEGRERARQWEAVARVAATLSHELRVEPVAETVIRQAIEILGADAASLFSADSNRRELLLLAHRGISEEAVRMLAEVPFDSAFATARAATTLQVQTVEDLLATGLAQGKAIAEHEGHRGLVAVPLSSRGRLVGVLNVATRQPHRFSRREIDFISTLADLFAAALENARLYEEVQQTLQLREEFLRDSAHELRTPVTSVKGYSQLLLRLVPEQDTRLRQLVEGVAQQADRLARLVQDLLEVAEFQAGQPDLHRELFDLYALAREVVAAWKSDRGTGVVLREGHPILVNADRARLYRVLQDLLQASSRSAPEGTDVDVGLAIRNGSVLITVHDQGVSIPSERQPHLFEPFYPIRAPGGEGYTPSRGVGLYIDRAIVEAHGGALWFESREGKGTTFYVRLPAAK